MKTSRPFGVWESPITPADMATELQLMDVAWCGDAETLVWVEGRGAQGVVCAKRGDAAARDISGSHNVRGGVGYGGGEIAVHEQTVFFAATDGRLYRTEVGGGAPIAITPAYGKVASPSVSPDGKWVLFVHTDGATDVIAAVDSEGRQWPWKLVTGADFYMQPAWSPDGTRLAWIAWDHPQMPWDGSRLETATVHVDARGFHLGEVDVWAGRNDVSVQHPSFSADGRYLAYTSDETGYSHLYVRDLQSSDSLRISKGEADLAGPAWIQGRRPFCWSQESRTLFGVRNERGQMHLCRFTVDGVEAAVESAQMYTAVAQPAVSARGHIAFLGSSSAIPPRIVTLLDGDTPRVERRASNERVAPAALSRATPVEWIQRRRGARDLTVYANYYPPASTRFESSGRPPAIVMIHGGPTSQKVAAWEPRNQFFATRGFAVLDVNYRGSTGYGRDYMDALRGQWGIADVEDALGGAKYLVDADLADPDRLVIMGGSAGGYTVLQALTDHPGAFAAGVCLYGIGNLFTLTMETHKFESNYNDSLLGALPEAATVFRERSPLFKADRIRDAVAVYHGKLDKVVPLNQAEEIVASLSRRGVPHSFHVYENEGHGWRHPENITHFYETLLTFLTQHVVYK